MKNRIFNRLICGNIFIVLSIIFVSRCDIYPEKLILINSSNETVYYCLLTDTLLYNDLYLYEIPPHDTVKPFFGSGGEGVWEYVINKESEDSTLHIFLFSEEHLSRDIITNQKYERMDFKVKDLDSVNWIVTYSK